MFKTVLSLAFVASSLLLSPALADPHPDGFEPARFNGSTAPITESGVTTFHIADRECSDIDYGDGRGETDCINGNVRSMLRGPDAQLGQSLEYKFDILVDPALEYEGYFNPDSGGFEPKAWDSHLRLASWEGTFLHNFIYALKASTRTGITFVGETCQAPEDLGKWVSFSMKVKWDGEGRGWVSVTCDGRYVYNDEATSSNVAPDCYVQNQCVPGEVRNPKKLLFLAGVQMGGWGYSYKETGHDSQFVALPPAGITVKMRNLAVTPDPVLYDDVAKAVIADLQGALNAVGCDVGTPDGLVGRRTREAALSCRQFSAGAMPSQLNVATAPTFLALYSQPDVADLPSGVMPTPKLTVHARQQGSETSGVEKRVSANFTARVANEPGGLSALDFLVIGDFDAGGGKFEWLSLLFMPDLDGNLAADECDGVRIEEWANGQQKAVLELEIAGSVYTARDTACLAEKLPAPVATEAAFTVAHFSAIAESLVEDGTIAGVAHDGLRTFLEQAARGEVTIVLAPLFAIPAGIPVPTHQLDVKVGAIETQDDGTLVVPLYAEVGPLGLGFEELEFLLIGQYGVPFKNFIDLEILMVEPVKSSVAKAVEECRRMRIEDWGDGKRIVFQLNRALNRFAAQGGECVLAALDEQHAAETRFLFDSFADIASSMFQTGVAQNLSKPELTVFFERAAKGEITFVR